MTTIAPDQPLTRNLASNQTSTMQAYPMPSYPMPQQQAILAARQRTARPLYDDPGQLDPTRYNPLLASQRQQPAATPAAGMGSVPLAPVGGAAGTAETMQDMGPTIQTAPGGVIGGGGADFSDPQTWTDFFNARGTRTPTPPAAPPVMQQSRPAWAPGQTAWQVGRGLTGLQPQPAAPAPVNS